MSKKRIGALGASVASAALIGSVLSAPAAMAQQDGPTPEAFAIGASGLVNVAKTPHAVGDSNGPMKTVHIPGDPVADVTLLQAETAPGEASSKVAGIDVVKLPSTPLPGIEGNPEYLIEADVITASCTQGNVTSDIASLKIAGQTIPIDTNPNTGIPAPLDQVLDITINKQYDNDDGSTTVNAVSVEILKGADKLTQDIPILGKLIGQTITLASATCAPTEGGGDDTTPPDDGDDTTPPEDNGDNGDDNNGNGNGGNGGGASNLAPQPEPQPAHIAVTG